MVWLTYSLTDTRTQPFIVKDSIAFYGFMAWNGQYYERAFKQIYSPVLCLYSGDVVILNDFHHKTSSFPPTLAVFAAPLCPLPGSVHRDPAFSPPRLIVQVPNVCHQHWYPLWDHMSREIVRGENLYLRSSTSNSDLNIFTLVNWTDNTAIIHILSRYFLIGYLCYIFLQLKEEIYIFSSQHETELLNSFTPVKWSNKYQLYKGIFLLKYVMITGKKNSPS